MNRICSSLAEAGYEVTLVGRKLPGSLQLKEEKYKQKRLNCWFKKGKLFYFEYNIRLSTYLQFKKMDAICAIDLDTILACHTVSVFKRVKRIYDAHELFTELKEVITRPRIQRLWQQVEKKMVPRFPLGYTVSESIAEEFHRRYQVNYATIRNTPRLQAFTTAQADEKFILYQGAVNEARAFEYLVPAMQWVNTKLVICGDGNFMPQLKTLIKEAGVEQKVELKGMLSPAELWDISQQAYIGIALAEKEGLNQYFALPNKFFDYIHAGLPQVTMNYPEYEKLNKQYGIAVLIDDLIPQQIAAVINNLLENSVMYRQLRENCLAARLELNWQEEEKKLINFYKDIFDH
jgi:glycosyltransferase involved in cell wall biosynthesis